MALSTTIDKKQYSGDGTTTAFAFPYPYINQTDLRVKTRTGTGAGTSEVDKSLTTQFTVLPLLDATNGGTVTMLTAPDATTTLVIFRDMSVTQTLDLINDGEMPAESVEKNFDKMVMIMQRMKDQLGRVALLHETDTSLTMHMPYLADRTSSFLGFDASGRFVSLLLATVTPSIVVSAYIATLLDDASASAARATLGVLGAGESAVTAVKTVSQALLSTDGLALCNTSVTAWTATLPLANVGKWSVRVKKVSNDFNPLTVIRAGSDTIVDYTTGLTSTTLDTCGEEVAFISDGTNTIYPHRSIPSFPAGYTPALVGFGTPTIFDMRWIREKNCARLEGRFSTGTSTTTEARLPLPTGLVADASTTGNVVCGVFTLGSVGAVAPVLLRGASQAYIKFGFQAGSLASGNALNGDDIGTNKTMTIAAVVPITGWKG